MLVWISPDSRSCFASCPVAVRFAFRFTVRRSLDRGLRILGLEAQVDWHIAGQNPNRPRGGNRPRTGARGEAGDTDALTLELEQGIDVCQVCALGVILDLAPGELDGPAQGGDWRLCL